jgi:hypothetical protein
MKAWLGVIGRACVEFAIILVLISFAVGASMSVATPSAGLGDIYRSAARAAVDLVALAAVVTLFLAFFSFELRVRSRAAGWLGLLVLGALLLSFGIGIRRVPLIREAVAAPASGGAAAAQLMSAGAALQQGRTALWIRSFEGTEAIDAVAVDFGSDYPRLAYAPRAELDPATGDTEIQGRTYRAALPEARPFALVPEASFYSGSWIWDRLARMDGEPILRVLAAAGGFLLLAIGFRFLCRITGWPLANALLAAAGLAGLVALDAALSGGAALGLVEGLARRAGVTLHGTFLLASAEGLIGLALGAAELATAPRRRRRRDE